VVLQFAKINKKTKNSWKKLEKQEDKKVTTKGISNSKKKVIKNIYFETKLKKNKKEEKNRLLLIMYGTFSHGRSRNCTK